jgi:hypothetical protein
LKITPSTSKQTLNTKTSKYSTKRSLTQDEEVVENNKQKKTHTHRAVETSLACIAVGDVHTTPESGA